MFNHNVQSPTSSGDSRKMGGAVKDIRPIRSCCATAGEALNRDLHVSHGSTYPEMRELREYDRGYR